MSAVEDVPCVVHGPADSKLRAKRNAVAWRRGKDISYRQDESQLQPLLVSLPLLAYSGGLGGLGSSERSVATICKFSVDSKSKPAATQLVAAF